MRTLSMLLCLLLVIIGLVQVVVHDNAAGVIVMIIFTLAFLIIATPRKKMIEGYDPKHWMNR